MTSATTPHPGERIRERREALGLSREGLAYKAGLAGATIERAERGVNYPRRATLAVIEAVLAEAEQETAAA